MKKILFLIIISLYLVGCSSSVNTANMTPEQRLTYAKSLYTDEDYLDALNEFQSLILQCEYLEKVLTLETRLY